MYRCIICRFQLSFKWFEELERECDFDFGSSGAVLLVKAEEDSGALDFGDMMHPNYDYSNENYDIGNDFQCSPGKSRLGFFVLIGNQ